MENFPTGFPHRDRPKQIRLLDPGFSSRASGPLRVKLVVPMSKIIGSPDSWELESMTRVSPEVRGSPARTFCQDSCLQHEHSRPPLTPDGHFGAQRPVIVLYLGRETPQLVFYPFVTNSAEFTVFFDNT